MQFSHITVTTALATHHFSLVGWVFILDEKEEGMTRLIVRTRASYAPKMFRMLTRPMLFPADFLMARMMLRTIKQRVEQGNAGAIGKSQREEPVVLSTKGGV